MNQPGSSVKPPPVWGLEFEGETSLVGPLPAFGRHSPSVTVVVAEEELARGLLGGRHSGP